MFQRTVNNLRNINNKTINKMKQYIYLFLKKCIRQVMFRGVIADFSLKILIF